MDDISTSAYLLVLINDFPADKVITENNRTYDIYKVEWETQRWEGSLRDVIVFFCLERDQTSKLLHKLSLPWKKCIKNEENISRVEKFREKFLS